MIGLPRLTPARAGKFLDVRVGVPVVHTAAPLVKTPLQCRDPRLEMGGSPPHLNKFFFF